MSKHISISKQLSMQPSANATTILEKRYFRGEDKGFTGMCKRVAKAVASVEKDANYRKKMEEVFFNLMNTGLFMPNSPTLMNAGRPLGQLSACFVLPVEDSIPGIFEAVKQTAIIHQTGGGTGFSFSRLRQAGAKVKSTSGESSGPMIFMDTFNAATESIKQGGARRGANMGALRCDHPDILSFIRYKKDRTKLTNFNVSVAVTEAFMKAVDSGSEYPLVEPHTGKIVGMLDARAVWNEIVDYAWESGEPGILFIDEANHHNPTPHIGEYETTNPCGEQWLLPFESCNLGSVNLALMVKNGDIDWDLLTVVVLESIHFLDNIIDANRYPIPEIDAMTKANRKVGLGVMGFADMLAQMGIAYDSDKGVELAEKIMGYINNVAHDASEWLSVIAERGNFPNHKGSIYDGKRAQRNATVTTIAPTGTISIIAGASSGVEPLFAVSFIRNQADTIMFETNPLFEKIAKERGFWSEELLKKISADGGSVAHCDEVPEDVKRAFRTAHDISPEWHVRVQAAFQKHTDNAVSKTVNFPKEATREEVEKAFKLAYQLKCKGITIYRDGSRDEQVLSTAATTAKETPVDAPVQTSQQEPTKRERPNKLKGATYEMKTGCGPLYITINEDQTGLFELFTTMGKAGGCAASQAEALGRMVSLAWRSGVGAKQVIKQLSGISCHCPAGFGENKISSCADAVAKAISAHMEELTGDEDFHSKKQSGHQGACPECGSALEHASGCAVCHSCGFSAC